MQNLIFGLAYGSMYSLIALAIGIVFSTTYIINFAHASVIMLGTMVAYWSMAVYRLPYAAAVIIGGVANMLLSVLLYFACVKGLGNLQKNTGWIITLFGASIIIDNGARMLFGMLPNPFPLLMGGRRLEFLGANITWHEIIMILVAAAIGISYQTMCNKTKIGRALRAVSSKPETAKLMGINSTLIIITTFAIAGVVAMIAGALIAPYTFASYLMTTSVGMKGFAAALIGGFGDTKGAFIGGIALGLTEQLLTMVGVPPTLINAFSFGVMILVIVFLPGGLVNAKIFNRSRVKAKKV